MEIEFRIVDNVGDLISGKGSIPERKICCESEGVGQGDWRGESRPPAVEVSSAARGSGVDQTSPAGGDGARRGVRRGRTITAPMFLPRSPLARRSAAARSSFSTESIIWCAVPLAPAAASSRLAAPTAVLLPADDFNVRSQRPEHKSFYGNFIPNAPRSPARSGTSI
ncbi:jg12002 [Pararge aegeria aegeria]|uniref:Jg12002 protein n=1 Tax=Pararge aegeria aegeria TaxID=348720 RepID=A0A8S4R5W4_9NEOP|nr:jg12002 [Pararge aegeria aegeria]